MFHVPAHKNVAFPAAQISIAAVEPDYRDRMAVEDSLTVEDGKVVRRLASVHALHCAAAGVAPCVPSPVIEPAKPAVPEFNSALYRKAFAFHSPLMQHKWKRGSEEGCVYASLDIHNAIVACGSDSAYLGKLYAELDAIRDRLHAIRRRKA